ncbi:RsmB/NOP family class I SAM-dependent RNA methyltransferase [Rothia sp. P7181]|uniref:RsmB/NOP family class I SAM-dependent RNA methyltransferase n=1 Tax=Rothia sp. P7181 TaxID=3402663 RepID=UPI003ADA8046
MSAEKPRQKKYSTRSSRQGENTELKRGGGGQTRRNAQGRERNRRAQHERAFSASVPRARRRTSDPARKTAFEVINSVALSDSYANLVLPQAIRKHRLDQRDAGFATELTYGTLRYQGRYDVILTHCVDRPLEKTGAQILTCLRMGVHQLLAMRVPAHAALNSTVALARAEIGSGPAHFINAVLRRVSERTPEQWEELLVSEAKDELHQLSVSYSHPTWIVRAFRQALVAHGRDVHEIAKLLEADNLAPIVNLVALPQLGSLDEALAKGAQKGELVEGSALYSQGDLGRLESVRQGTVRAQDVGSQLVARALAQAPLSGKDEVWLDLCAGPGGKAALLGALVQERGGVLIANESAPHRASLVEKSLKPLDSQRYRVLTGDGRTIDQTLKAQSSLPKQLRSTMLFDRVMVDVPCSGLGALRRRPEARWRKSPRDIAELLTLQKQLFDAAVQQTRSGGLIAYVTCSPHMAETRNIVQDILRTHDVQLLDSAQALAEVALTDDQGQSLLSGERAVGCAVDEKNMNATTAQLWPHVHGTDAMFFALFQKK